MNDIRQMNPDDIAQDRFWDKVDKSEDCWIWIAGSYNQGGYGAFGVRGRSQLAHRVSWVLTYGSIPIGALVLHHCDNPPCVRPDHLFLGTRAMNNRDRQAKGRSAIGDRHGFRVHPERSAKGMQNARSKLTTIQVRTIRGLIDEGFSLSWIARGFRVSHSTIGAIRDGRSWAWLK